MAQAFVLNYLGASSVRLILWFHFCLSGSFLNFFLLKECVKSRMQSGRSSGFVRSSSFPIFCCPLLLSSIVCILQFLGVNNISWCFVLYVPRHLVNFIVPLFQSTFGLCFTSQSYPKNISVLFKSVTAALIHFLYPLIFTFSGTTCVTSPFFVLSTLKTLNSTRKTRASFRSGSLTGIYLQISYVNILVSWTLLVKRPICWTISI